MNASDRLVGILLAFAGVLAGIATFRLGWSVLIVLAMVGAVAGAARIQAHMDFSRDPVASAWRLELWPLIQLPAGALLTTLLLIAATSLSAGSLFGVTSPTGDRSADELLGAAASLLITGMFALLTGEDRAKLGAAHAFKHAILTMRFVPLSLGQQAQMAASIDGIVGPVGWGFHDRRRRARIVAEALHRPGT